MASVMKANSRYPELGPLTAALTEVLKKRIPNDSRCRTYADLIAEVLVSKAIKGDIQALKEILDRVEGTSVPIPEPQLSEEAQLIAKFTPLDQALLREAGEKFIILMRRRLEEGRRKDV
jgi:hypothetical protein